MFGRRKREHERATLARMAEVGEVLEDVRYRHDGADEWSFWVHGNDPDNVWIQVGFWATDTRKGVPAFQTGREWRIAPWMGRNEIVKTALAAVIAAVQHEALENFTYRGEQVFHPHYDVDTLVEACAQPWA